ncbi:hypothetical protein [Aliikangiella maris]|uniref:Uncharacterized protein n=2 Tax=Aliikangiella maris TaxID=3162458 RepID=A0ABV3MJK7_9GAMM
MDIVDGDNATLELLSNYCCGIVNGVNQPYVKIFVNLTRALIMSDIFIPLQPDRIVIEILEDIDVDPELLTL